MNERTTTIPVTGIREAMVLVRNLETAEAGAELHYSWSARDVAGYPFETATVQATLLARDRGVEISWETRSEQGLVGFNVVRREVGGTPERVNPVWIPALGDSGVPAAYQFVDRTADPWRIYTYAIEGVTTSGLASVTEPVLVTRPISQR